MSSPPSVSVILPTYNRAQFLNDSISSVLAQTNPIADFIVVDDGSSDNTKDVVTKFQPSVTYIYQKNSGKLAAINNGLDHCKGDLVWVMDDDDLAPPDALSNLVAPFVTDPDLVMSYGSMTIFSGEGATLTEQKVQYPEDYRPFFVCLLEACFISGHPCVLSRREAIDAMRPFDPAIFASVDYYLHLHVAKRGPVAAVDTIVLRQRQHNGLRGPLTKRYGESERAAKWVENDRYIFTALLDELPLRAYLDTPPWSDRPLTERERRLCLLQRAVIAGRKKLWDRALADMMAGMELGQTVLLDEKELTILQGLLDSPYGCIEFTGSKGTVMALRKSIGDRIDRAAILAAISRPLLREIKARRSVGRMLQTWVWLMDVPATVTSLGNSLKRNLTRVQTRRAAR